MLSKLSLPLLALLCLIPIGPTILILHALILGPGGGGLDSIVRPTYWPSPLPMVLHGAAGLTMAALLPLQFWPRFRRHRPKWHRRAGKACIIGGIGLGLSGLLVLASYPPAGGPIRTLGMAALSWALILSFGLGWLRARQRRFAAHRGWMLRACGFALSPFVAALAEAPLVALDPALAPLCLEHSRWSAALACWAFAEWRQRNPAEKGPKTGPFTRFLRN